MTPSVDETVAKLAASMEYNPYTLRPLTIQDIVDVVRRAFGDDIARTIKITVH